MARFQGALACPIAAEMQAMFGRAFAQGLLAAVGSYDPDYTYEDNEMLDQLYRLFQYRQPQQQTPVTWDSLSPVLPQPSGETETAGWNQLMWSTLNARAKAYSEGNLGVMRSEDYSLAYTRRHHVIGAQLPRERYTVEAGNLTNMIAMRYIANFIAANANAGPTELAESARTVACHPLATVSYQAMERELLVCGGKSLRPVQLMERLKVSLFRAIQDVRELVEQRGREDDVWEPASLLEYLEDVVAGAVEDCVRLKGGV